MSSRNRLADMVEAAPPYRAARERLVAAGRSGDPVRAEFAARAAMWIYNREALRVLLRMLVQACMGALRNGSGRPDAAARRWRGGNF